MSNKSLVSINDLSKEEILDLIEKASHFEQNPNRDILAGKVVATLFFEPSTRTRLSFETAVNRLGGRVIGFSDASTTSSTISTVVPIFFPFTGFLGTFSLTHR